MDSSSSDELTSDEELEEIIDLAWTKTKQSFTDSESDDTEDLFPPTSKREVASTASFIIDKLPSRSSRSSNSDINKDKRKDSKHTREKQPSESDSPAAYDGDADTDQSSFFVLDKRPSLINSASQSDPPPSQKNKKEKNKQKKTVDNESADRQFQKKTQSLELSSSLQVKWDPSNIYINLHSQHAPQPKHGTPIERISKETEEIMKKSVITPDFEKKAAVPAYDEDTRRKQKERKKQRENTKGKGWYHMPKGEITEETKNDLMALKMRRALDPKRFYKGDDIKGMPKYFQFGTVVEDASEFYSARIPKKQRKKSMVEELMADAEFRKFNKRKYAEVQDLKAKGLGPYQGVRTMKTKKKKRR